MLSHRRGAVLLDRDGVLNEDLGYVADPARLVWRPGAIEAVRLVNARGLLAIVVTNQSGIGRGLFGEPAFHAFMAAMQHQLGHNGAHLDAVYFCPHRPDEGCRCRKPAPGLLEQAIVDHDLHVPDCVMLGDRASDLLAAERVGMRAWRVGRDGPLPEVQRVLATTGPARGRQAGIGRCILRRP